MKLPAPLKWFRWLPKFEPFKRPEFPVDYVLKKRQEAAAQRLGENSIKSLRSELSEAVRIGGSGAGARVDGEGCGVAEMRRWLKVALIELYCRGLLPASVVAFVFRHVDLRGV